MKYSYIGLRVAVRRLPCKVLDSDIEIVHEWFTERGDSIHDSVERAVASYRTNDEFLGYK